MAKMKGKTVCLKQASGEGWNMYQGDCVELIKGIPDNSIHFGIHSPPFANLYIYDDSPRDMGNSYDEDEFFTHYEYLIAELYRTTKPGRLCAVHCKDLPKYMNRDGAAGLKDFPGAIIRSFESNKWTFHSRVTIWKDPVIEMQRTKNHGLLWRNFTTRGEVCRQGMADYLIVFRKNTDESEDKQVQNTPQPGDYIGDNPPTKWDSERDLSIQVWQKYASPVWFDINQTRVLNYRHAKDSEDEKHICPLQLDVIARAVQIWSNKGDTVLSPFCGIGSEGHESLKLGRKFVGFELKESYFDTAVKNLQTVERESKNEDMFAQAGLTL